MALIVLFQLNLSLSHGLRGELIIRCQFRYKVGEAATAAIGVTHYNDTLVGCQPPSWRELEKDTRLLRIGNLL